MKQWKQTVRAFLLALPAFMVSWFRRRPVADTPDSSLHLENASLRSENTALRAEIAQISANNQSLRTQNSLPALDLRYPSGQRVPPGALPWTHPTPLGTQFLLPDPSSETRTLELTQSAGTVVLFRDLTLAHAQDTEIETVRLRGQTLADAGRAIVSAADAQSVYRAITEGALSFVRHLENARALLYTYGGRGGPIVLQCTEPEEMPKRPRTRAQASLPEFAFNAASPLLWKLYVAREPVSITDIETDPVLASSDERAFLRGALRETPPVTAALFLPLLEGTTVTGHLLITHSGTGGFEENIAQALAIYSSLAALACARVRLGAEVRQHLEQADALWSACSAAVSAVSEASLADTLTEMAGAACGASVCTLTRRSDTSWQTLGARHREEQSLVTGQSAPVCPCDRLSIHAAERGCPTQTVGLESLPLESCRWRSFAGHSGSHSALSVPVPGHIPGSLSFIRHGGAPFTSAEVRMAETFAAVASLALERLSEAHTGARQGAD